MLNYSIPTVTQSKYIKYIEIIIEAISETFNESDWKEFGLKTKSLSLIQNHNRLLRSFKWQDPDYKGNAISVADHIFTEKPDSIEIAIQFSKIKKWVQEHHSKSYSEIYGDGSIEKIVKATKEVADEIDVTLYEERIQHALIHGDTPTVIGQTKELIESVTKYILKYSGAEIGANNFNSLIKKAIDTLDVVPENPDGNKKGLNAIKQLSTSITGIACATNDLRHLYGTGHGKINAPHLDQSTAQLIATTGVALAKFMLEQYKTKS